VTALRLRIVRTADSRRPVSRESDCRTIALPWLYICAAVIAASLALVGGDGKRRRHPGFLVLADLTGYTAYLTGSELALGFLGLSIPPPTPTLGAMLSEALTLLMFAPHVAIVPGVAITLAVFAFNILGDSLRDVLDPRLRSSGS